MDAEPDGSEEVMRLLQEHVPALAAGLVQLKGIVRVRGYRTIVAVHSTDRLADPVGSCIGERGIHIKKVVQRLSGEKIDMVRWSESVERFVRNLIVPALADRVVLYPAHRTVCIYTAPDYKSLIIGPNGKRLEMISRLGGLEVASE